MKKEYTIENRREMNHDADFHLTEILAMMPGRQDIFDVCVSIDSPCKKNPVETQMILAAALVRLKESENIITKAV